MKIENLNMKTKKIIALMMAMALAVTCLAACGGAPADEDAGGNDANAGTIKITDHADKEVEVPAEINRIAVWTKSWACLSRARQLLRTDCSDSSILKS